ncbi:MAG TPA: FAD-dependent oxidoreductase [Polyangia bacterium]|jgi:NADPH-dependent 2,4-dienoyl-CoA reductase/sulfur reductase-like enzyme/nitrite reductase/ring-hydroxylating ferredoxin subunit
MGEAASLTGPDLAQGIDEATLVVGEPVLGHAHGEAVIVVRAEGEIFAVGATCSHYGGPLAEGLVVGSTVRCPLHHACFDLKTGAVRGAPAFNPIACYQVEKLGTRIRVAGRATPSAVAPVANAPKQIVIVGGGAAGHFAAETLRQRGFAGTIRMLGRDPSVPYDRPNLSKDFLAGTASEDWIPLRPRSFYEEQSIALETGVEVTALELAAREVTLGDGRRVGFDRLLLATGAEPVRLPVPGADAPHVHLLRTLADCQRLIAACAGAQRVALIGSGFIGLEAAAALRTRGLDVAVVSPDAAPLGRVVGAEVSALLRRLHEEHGVVFHLGESVARVDADAVVTASGKRIPADLVVVAIGVRPATALASAAGLAVDNGIVVDEQLETNVAGVFAAGDVARFPDPRSGKHIRVEHWAVAQRMGAVAAGNMLGDRRHFSDVPFFWSTHYDVTLSYVGHAESVEDLTLDGRPEARSCRVQYRDNGKVAAVLTIGRDHESLEAERALELRV